MRGILTAKSGRSTVAPSDGGGAGGDAGEAAAGGVAEGGVAVGVLSDWANALCVSTNTNKPKMQDRMRIFP